MVPGRRLRLTFVDLRFLAVIGFLLFLSLNLLATRRPRHHAQNTLKPATGT
jgi:hypothetical protein